MDNNSSTETQTAFIYCISCYRQLLHWYTCYANIMCLECVFSLTPQYWSSLKSWGGTAVGFPALLLISSRSSPPTEMSTSSYWMLLLSRIRITSACWDFTWKNNSGGPSQLYSTSAEAVNSLNPGAHYLHVVTITITNHAFIYYISKWSRWVIAEDSVINCKQTKAVKNLNPMILFLLRGREYIVEIFFMTEKKQHDLSTFF